MKVEFTVLGCMVLFIVLIAGFTYITRGFEKEVVIGFVILKALLFVWAAYLQDKRRKQTDRSNSNDLEEFQKAINKKKDAIRKSKWGGL